MSNPPPPQNLKELQALSATDDFLNEVSSKAGFLEPAERVLEKLLTDYAELKEIKKRVIKLSRLDINIPILILGETGTGKELVAEALHGARKGNFVPINCGAIPTELLEAEFFGATKGAYTGATSDRIGYVKQAENGTLFLDEIGELPKHLQAKLLRVLQTKKYRQVGSPVEQSINFRLISATNRKDLDDSTDFRLDLYYRIAGHLICLPNLADRGAEDIKLIVNKFAASSEIAKKILNDVLGQKLKGNVRQLLNIIEEHNVLLS
jgi:two-component system response regulator PilR (NtrC family)